MYVPTFLGALNCQINLDDNKTARTIWYILRALSVVACSTTRPNISSFESLKIRRLKFFLN